MSASEVDTAESRDDDERDGEGEGEKEKESLSPDPPTGDSGEELPPERSEGEREKEKESIPPDPPTGDSGEELPPERSEGEREKEKESIPPDPPTGDSGEELPTERSEGEREKEKESIPPDPPTGDSDTEIMDTNEASQVQRDPTAGSNSAGAHHLESPPREHGVWERKPARIHLPRKLSQWSSQDTIMYRNHYPGKQDNKSVKANAEFYLNQQPCYPEGDFIDNIHSDWYSNYRLLESHHGYIQWLFPIREQGMNFLSEELQLHEIKTIRSSPEASQRVLKSYQMMLDFYGMRLKDEKTGELERAPNWRERFRHLNSSMHNLLRITRILKCLGELGFEHLKAPFVRFVLHEAFVKGTLWRTVDSAMNYWTEVLRDEEERKAVWDYARELEKQQDMSSDDD